MCRESELALSADTIRSIPHLPAASVTSRRREKLDAVLLRWISGGGHSAKGLRRSISPHDRLLWRSRVGAYHTVFTLVSDERQLAFQLSCV